MEEINQTEKNKVALGYASLLLVAAWQAARDVGAIQSPAVLSEIEKRIADGSASPVIAVQRIGSTVRLTVAVVESTGFQNIFDSPVLDVNGPLIFSREQFEQVLAVAPGKMN